MPFKEAAAKRKPVRAQPRTKRCTNYGWPREAQARQGAAETEGPTFPR